MFSMAHKFDKTSRSGPKVLFMPLYFLHSIPLFLLSLNIKSNFCGNLQAFVSEYAVTGSDAGTGSLLAAVAEAAFLIGLEKNRFLILKTMTTLRNFSNLMDDVKFLYYRINHNSSDYIMIFYIGNI